MSTQPASDSSASYKSSDGFFAEARRDIPAGIVVFLVAVPLCLGIAQASGAPPLSGLIAGIMGGLVVTAISQSPLSVSGPAAGLAVIVMVSIQGFDPQFAAGKTTSVDFSVALPPFLLAVVIAGVIQLLLGVLKLGSIAHYFPNAVIKGMLASIGILISLKQLPHAVGYDADFEGDLAFAQADGHNTFTAIIDAFGAYSPAATTITICCFVSYLVWPKLQKGPLKFIPPALVVVVVGALLALIGPLVDPMMKLSSEHLVTLPVPKSVSEITGNLIFPAFSRITDPTVWTVAFTVAFVASIETLLCLEAVDRLDPRRRISPPNRELVAQGFGNIASGMIGGLPVTSVIVRSSANVAAGGQSRLSSMFHGALLVVGVVFAAGLLNHIPMAALAVILLFVGYKLSPPSLWKAMWNAGSTQFIPFASTVLAVVMTDLLKGTLFGLCVGIVFAIRQQQKDAIEVSVEGGQTTLTISKDLTFLNKAGLKDALLEVPNGAKLTVDRRVVDFFDDDIEEILLNFEDNAQDRGITVTTLDQHEVSERRIVLEETQAAIDEALALDDAEESAAPAE